MAKISREKFVKAREEAKVTRMDLVEVSKLTYGRIFQIETDEVSHVNDLAVEAMAKKMNVKPGSLAP